MMSRPSAHTRSMTPRCRGAGPGTRCWCARRRRATMAAAALPGPRQGEDGPPLMLGGCAALAESAWMGSAQATEVLEPLRLGQRLRRIRVPGRPRLAGLLTRELSVAEASVILMASFFLSALLGAVRQILF